MPRTAGTTIVLVWFTWARALYCCGVEHLQVPQPPAEDDEQRQGDDVQAEQPRAGPGDHPASTPQHGRQHAAARLLRLRHG